MKIKLFILLLAINLLSVAHADILIVAHPDVPVSKIQTSELADIFLKRHASLGGGTGAIPVNRPANSELRQQFESAVMHGMSARELKNYWLKMRFKGVRPPLVQDSDEAVILFVRRVSGAIAYINSNKVPEGLKLLARIEY